MINLSIKALMWALTTQADREAQLQLRVDELEIENEELEELRIEHENGLAEIQELTDNADVLEEELNETEENFASRRFSPWKEFCSIKQIPEAHTTWPRQVRFARWLLWNHCKDLNYFTKGDETCYYYIDSDSRNVARQYWQQN
jgi:hypothetical protein